MGNKAIQILASNLDRFIGKGKKFSSYKAAEAAWGVPASTIQRAKKQESGLGVDTLGEIAHALGVEPWELLHPDLRPDSRPSHQFSNPDWPMPGVDPDEFKLVPDDERREVIDLIKTKIKRHNAIKSSKAKAA